MNFVADLWNGMRRGSTPQEILPTLPWATSRVDLDKALTRWKEQGLVEWDVDPMYARLTKKGEGQGEAL